MPHYCINLGQFGHVETKNQCALHPWGSNFNVDVQFPCHNCQTIQASVLQPALDGKFHKQLHTCVSFLESENCSGFGLVDDSGVEDEIIC